MKSNLVFFHAFPFTAEMWKNQMDYFSKDYQCFSPNLPGFGSTPLPDSPITFETYIDNTISYLEKNSLKKSIWCGLSMGGYLALRLFERSPEMCQGLVLCDTKAAADNNEAKLKRWDTIKMLKKEMNKFQDAQWKALVGESSQNNTKLKEDFVKLISQTSTEGITNGLVALATRTDSQSLLSKINVPSLIMVGEEDKVTPLAEAEFLHKNIKNSKFSILKRCGHLSNLEQPELFNKEIESFLKKNNF